MRCVTTHPPPPAPPDQLAAEVGEEEARGLREGPGRWSRPHSSQKNRRSLTRPSVATPPSLWRA